MSTQGCHHIGLTVSRLEESAAFFTDLLGWKEVRRDANYPAIFVSDDTLMITLWATQGAVVKFNKANQVGLHHLALRVASETELQDLYQKLDNAGVVIEFKPELLKTGPAKHMMCYEPSGIRIEFIWLGNQ